MAGLIFAGRGPLIVGPWPESGEGSEGGEYLSAETIAMIEQIWSKVQLIGTGTVKVNSPVLESGDLDLVRGDDYLLSLARAISLSSEQWPDLTEATIMMTAVSSATGRKSIDALVGEVITPITSGETPAMIRFELPHDLTQQLELGRRAHRFDVQADIGELRVTLIVGFISVTRDLTTPEEE